MKTTPAQKAIKYLRSKCWCFEDADYKTEKDFDTVFDKSLAQTVFRLIKRGYFFYSLKDIRELEAARRI